MILQMRQERIERGWTLDYVAKNVGLTKVSIHDIEICRRKPSYEVLVKLEDLFGKTHRELFAEVKDITD